MAHDALDRHFRRFREGGDVSALAEVFDEVAPELLRVARHLAPPSAEAHDLVQNTFLVAIQRAEAYDPQRPVKQWLLGILAKEAAHERRRGRRAVEVDRLNARTETDPSAAAGDLEFARTLERALAKLPEPYRNIVRPVLLEGKSPREVARTMGKRPGTVRVQLHRGLRMLREALPGGFALGALVALRGHGLAAVRAKVLVAGAGREATTSIAAGAGAAAAVGAWLATRTGLLTSAAVLAAALGAALWLALDPLTPRGRAVVPASARSEAGALGVEPGRGGLPRRAPAALAGDSAEAHDSAAVQVTGRVLGLDYQPARGAEVELDLPGAGRFAGRTDARGDFRLSAVLGGPGLWRGVVRARAAGGQADARSLALRSDLREAYLGTLLLGAAEPLSVRVQDPAGRGLAGAAVEVCSEGGALVLDRGITEAGGSVGFPAVPGSRLEVRAELDGRSGGALARGPRPRRDGIVVTLDRGVEQSSARAPEPLPESAPGPAVVLRLASPAGPVWNPGPDFLTAAFPLRHRLSADGEIEVEFTGSGSLAPGDTLLLNVAAQGFRPLVQRVTLRASGLPNPVDVRLDPYAWLLASLPRDPELAVELELQRFDAGIGAFGPTDLDWGGLMRPNTPAGEFRFDGLTPGTYRLRERGSDLCSEAIEVRAGDELVRAELDLTVVRRVRGRVVVPDQELIRQVSVVLEAEGLDDQPNRWAPRQRHQWTVRPDDEGRFSVLVPNDRPVRIAAYHPRLATAEMLLEGGQVPGELVLELVQGDELALELHTLAKRHALDRVRVLLYAGPAEGPPQARLYPRVEDGVARFTGVPPGRWNLWIDAGPKTGVQPLLLRDVLVPEGRGLELGEPRFEPGGRVVLQVLGNGADLGRLTLFARSHGEPEYVRSATKALADGRFQLIGLGPGTFTVRVQSPSNPAPLLEEIVQLAPGATATLTLPAD